MNKTKSEKGVKKKLGKSKTDIKKHALQKIDSLSWQMGKRKYSSREELYDR